MALRDNLRRAQIAKNDEFYTQISDIEKELRHYKDFLSGKTVFCNCDDPEESNFWKYFYLNFEHIGLKKLVATHYDPNVPTYKLEFDGKNIKKTDLKQNGDFRSPECVDIMDESDVVVTNPPFSLIKEYIPLLKEHNKDFIILGPQNSIYYKEIFPHFKSNDIMLGYNNVKEFLQPDGTFKKFGNVYWFTTFDIDLHHEHLIMYKKYSPEEYPSYVNYDGIDVNKVSNIPLDYHGNMGVPVNFLKQYNPDDFEIIGYDRCNMIPEIDTIPVSFLEDYRSQGGKGHMSLGMKALCFYDKDGKATFPYSRIVIRRKNNGNQTS